MSTSFVKKKRIVNERWESSQIKRNKATFKPSPEVRDDSESEEELVKTSARGSEVRKTGIMIVEAKIRTERRPSSMDLIPACVPESVGFEIEDILQKNWQSDQNGKGYNLDPDYGIKAKKSSKARSPKKKSPRTMSTEDLPPNMLPEDYLDEVISQYFNDDCGKKISAARRESLKQLLSENSSNDEEDEEEDDQITLSEEGVEEKPEARNKVKTDEELESEYKHIIFGAKKRKAPRLGFGSPKKKKKSSKDRDRSETRRKSHEELTMKPIKTERSVSPRKERDKIEIKNRPEEIPVTPPKIDKLTTPRKETLEEKFEKIVNEKKKQLKVEIETVPSNSNILPKFQSMSIPIKLGDDHMQKWAGKKASRKALDRSKLLMAGKKLYSFPKIEDVTGKYSKEEELVTCGICELLDPPVDPGNTQVAGETTEWVGCDCYRWFHKSCTKLTKFTEKFSCKSVRMRCQEAPDTAAITEPVAAVLQVAILKFIRDRDITFIEDILW